MANFCKNCGHPLENGRCPVCDGAAQSPSAPPSPPSAAPSAGGTGAVLFSTLGGDLQALFASKDPFRIAHAAGYALLALVLLFQAFLSLSSHYIYGLNLFFTWLDILGCIAVGVGAVGLLKPPAQPQGTSLVLGCAAALLGFSGVVNLLSMLASRYTALGYLFPCLLLLCLALGLAAKDSLLRWLCLGGAGALALLCLIDVLAPSAVFVFFQYLCLCYCALCAVLFLVKSGREPL